MSLCSKFFFCWCTEPLICRAFGKPSVLWTSTTQSWCVARWCLARWCLELWSWGSLINRVHPGLPHSVSAPSSILLGIQTHFLWSGGMRSNQRISSRLRLSGSRQASLHSFLRTTLLFYLGLDRRSLFSRGIVQMSLPGMQVSVPLIWQAANVAHCSAIQNSLLCKARHIMPGHQCRRLDLPFSVRASSFLPPGISLWRGSD